MSMRFRLGFRDCPINNHSDKTTHDRINDEQIKEINVCQETADGRTNDPCQVSNHPQNAETFLALFFRQDICDHSLLGGTRDAREQTHNNHKGKQESEMIDETESQGADGAEDQAE